MSLAACASETKKRAARAKLLSCQNPFASLPHSLLFLRNREKSAIVLVVVIIPFYAPRSIKRNNEKKNDNYNKRLHAILRIRIPE